MILVHAASMSRTVSTQAASKADSAGPRKKGALSRRGPSAKRVNGSRPRQNLRTSEVPDWAAAAVFERARIAAWEGMVSPLEATAVHPESASFIRNLPLAGRGAMPWEAIVHPIDRKRVTQFFENLTAAPAALDYRVVDRHGSVLWIRHSVEHLEGAGAKRRIQGFVTDIQAEKEYQLESLRVSEREQNRIGQDLHDDLCQVLAGVSCLMRVFEGRVAAKVPEELPNLKELNDQIIDAMHRTRALTHGLFPGKIQIADIRGALLELASQVKARFKVDISTQFAGRFPKHSTAQIIQIYRISQEAMSNAIKHGRATAITVQLTAADHAMELTISDNGDGFPEKENATPGVGLNIMKYRAALLGGDINVANGEPRGARVFLRYPFESHG